jgi:hypothetical protein
MKVIGQHIIRDLMFYILRSLLVKERFKTFVVIPKTGSTGIAKAGELSG